MDECDNLIVTLATSNEETKQSNLSLAAVAVEGTLQQQQQQQQQQQHKALVDNINDNHIEATTTIDSQYFDLNADTAGEADTAAADAEVEAVNMGQTESKKHAQRQQHAHGGELNAEQLHTKGTAMSFGFRKKLNSTPKKLKKLLGDKQLESATTTTTTAAATAAATTKDDNGNAATPIHFEKVGAAAQKTQTGSLGAAGKRFGYRGAVPRPASTGLAVSEQADANAENNNNTDGNADGHNDNGNGPAGVLVSNLKRRSKSAHAGAGRATTAGAAETKIAQPKTLTFNLNQNTTIEYQRRQFFGEFADDGAADAAQQTAARSGARIQRYNFQNLASMHANVIATPPASYAKFTLQTVSLPRPEYPVAISLNATTPTTPSSSVQSPVPAHATGARAKETSSTAARSHPLTSIHAPPTSSMRHLDQKSVKQMTNNSTRRGFSGSREISADSGIASMDMAMDSSGSGGSGSASQCGRRIAPAAASKRSRSRPRNLQMVMSGRHTFEVRDLLDDPPSSESNSFVESLALPKLPTDSSQTMPLPLVGLVRSNTVLSRESYERERVQQSQSSKGGAMPLQRGGSDDSESVDEEKLYLDSSTSEKSAKQQLTSPGSSTLSSSWCQAGESLAVKDCSSMSISSISEQPQTKQAEPPEEDMSLDLEDISLLPTDMPISTISSITETAAARPGTQLREPMLNMHIVDNREICAERPRSFNNAINECKFAELAMASSSFLLDDETSPTDSLVSSTESVGATGKNQKHKHNAELQEKDIDEISPELELELGSPISPGTPTHASHSLSLGSDCGNLIDDEIADQPALLFNSETQEGASGELSLKTQQTDTPTLMETHTGSLRSLKSQSKARTALQQAIELSLRTPAAVRKAVMEHAESLDTLSPCESICSDDLMMDFDMNSSLDSIDRSASVRSRSGSDLHKMEQLEELEQAELFSELDRKGSDVMKELNSLLRVRMQRSGGARERISAHLPARATRLLNRTRLQDQQQQQQQQCNNDSDNSLHSTQSGCTRKRSTATSRASTASSTSSLQRRQQQQQQQHQQQQRAATAASPRNSSSKQRHSELHSSSDDLMLYDKSFRNAMIQDVLQFKKQLLRLRRILQETETVNPFEHDNVQLFAACGLDGKQLNDIDLASLTSSTTEDPLQELTDLRRQVVYLQGQVDDRDRTIRLQRDLIEQLEAEKRQACQTAGADSMANTAKECISMATQTERTRPLAIGAEGLSRSKPEYTSYTTHFPTLLHCNDSTVAATTIIRHQQQYNGNSSSNSNSSSCSSSSNSSNSNGTLATGSSNHKNCQALQQTRRHTIISTTLTNYNQQLAASAYAVLPRRASIGWDTAAAGTTAATPTTATASTVHKPVRITLIGEPLQPKQCQTAAQNGLKTRYSNGCQSVKGTTATKTNGQTTHYQPLYNSNKITNPTVTIV